MVECADCMAWTRMENQPAWGECRRHAPSPRTGPDSSAVYGPFNFRGIWPYTLQTDYCHEHLEAPELMDEEMAEELMELPVFAGDQALTPDKFPADATFAEAVEKARTAAYGK